jgi:uncharacterized protein (DUF433 family)
MLTKAHTLEQNIPLGIGFYAVPEAARLLRMPPANIRRWLSGYSYSRGGKRHLVSALWQPQLPAFGEHIELGFRDLIELRFVHAFAKEGVGLKTIRHCLEYARQCVNDSHPFSTRWFRTDGRTIFLESIERAVVEVDTNADDTSPRALANEKRQLLDLKKRQYVFRDLIAQTFKDLDLDDSIVTRWRPYRGKSSIIIDPRRAFGQPIAAEAGVPTATLNEAVEAERSVARVAYLYNVAPGTVRDAVQFETGLMAA